MSQVTIPQPLIPYKQVIWQWYIFEDKTLEETQQYIIHCFPQLSDIRPNYPSLSTLKRAITLWNFRKYSQRFDRDYISGRLYVLFYEMNLNDSEIIRFLARDGVQVGLYTYASFSSSIL